MSATTVNAFPPLHAFASPRSWFLALIVLLHAGFFWALTNGLTIYDLVTAPTTEVVFVPHNPPKPPPSADIKDVLPRDFGKPIVPKPEVPTFETDLESNAPRVVDTDPRPTAAPVVQEGPGSGPVIVEPSVDPRIGLSEPEYPVSEIRMQHEGTVLLAVQILPNGRVGQVRIEQSSGYPKLDESAAREARRWRMKPGTQDGVAVAMWKRVPITFRLKD